VDAWVAGAVQDASDPSARPLVGVNVTGSRGWVLSGVDGSFALFAPIVGDCVVVSAGGLPGYSSTTGAAKYDSGVASYTIPLSLTRFSVQVSFDPAAGLAPVRLALPPGAFSNSLPFDVSVPAIAGAGLPPSVTVRIAVIDPSAGPGLLEVESVFAGLNGVTRLEVRGCVSALFFLRKTPFPPHAQSGGMFFVSVIDGVDGKPFPYPPGFGPVFSTTNVTDGLGPMQWCVRAL